MPTPANGCKAFLAHRLLQQTIGQRISFLQQGANMSLNSGVKKKTTTRDLFSLDHLGSTIFLVLAGFFCFLLIVGGLSNLHKTNAPSLTSQRAQEAAGRQVQTDLCGPIPVSEETDPAVVSQ